MSQIVGFVVLHNDGRPGNSRTRTDGILSSRLVPGSWKSPRRALRGPRTAENTARNFVPVFKDVDYSLEYYPLCQGSEWSAKDWTEPAGLVESQV